MIPPGAVLRLLTGGLALTALMLPLASYASGSVSLTYQRIHIDGFESTLGEMDIGTTDTDSLILEVDYHLTNRVSISAAVPYIRKRYRGGGAHRPDLISPPQNSQFIDDGEWHSDFQDWHLGVRYLLTNDPIRIEPFVGYSSPVSDYPFFGHAAVGQDIWHFDVGAHLSYTPPLSDAYFQVSPSYVFAEETLGQSIDHWRLTLAAGYRFTDRFSARLFVMGKEGDGLEFPDDFPPPRNTYHWYQHDRLVKHNYVNAGIGMDWRASPQYSLSTAVMRMIHADQIHIMKYAVSLTVTRAF
ncbi:MAG: transporter [Pseudomonadales bacterium]